MILKMLYKTKLQIFDYDLFSHMNNKLLRGVAISVLLLINSGSSIIFSTKYTVYNYFHINPRALTMLINWVKNLRDCFLPSLVQHHAMRSLLRLWFLRREKKAQEWQSATPPRIWVASWEPLLWSLPPGFHGNLWGSNTGNLTLTESREATNKQCSNFMDWISPCKVQVVVQTSSFAHLQNQVGWKIWPGNLVGSRSDWVGSSKEEFCLPWSQVCPWTDRCWVIAPPAKECGSQPHLTRRAG